MPSVYTVYVLVVPSPSKRAASGLWFTTESKLPSYDATDGPRSTGAASAWFRWAARLSRSVSPSQCFPAATGNRVATCELLESFLNSRDVPCGFRGCQWKWTSHLWGTTDVTVTHPQTAGKHLEMTLGSVICSVLSNIPSVGALNVCFVFRSPKRRRSRSGSRTRMSKHRRSRSRSRERRYYSPHSRSQERRERDKERERRQKGLPPPKSETLSSESGIFCDLHLWCVRV